MTKRLFAILLMLMLSLSAAGATILPATGVDEELSARMGIEATPAVLLCESLSVLDARGDQGGQVVGTLFYSGTATIPVIESWDGYAKILYAGGTKTGWVRNEALMLDPAWYLCDEETQVYAYPDVMSPRVAMLEVGTTLPILTEYADGESVGGWVCVSLRGASGWIRKTPLDTAGDTWFRPEALEGLTFARLEHAESGGTALLEAPEALAALTELLTTVADQGGRVAGCPFGAVLILGLGDGREITLEVATDSCCVYRVDGRDYAYARSLWSDEEGSPDSAVLFSLFGMDAQGNLSDDMEDR